MKKPLSTSERQKAFREKMKAQGMVELSVWVEKSNAEKVEKLSKKEGITKNELVNNLLSEID